MTVLVHCASLQSREQVFIQHSGPLYEAHDKENAAGFLDNTAQLGPTAYRQSGDQKPRRKPDNLYQVRGRGERPGEKRIGFIDQTGNLVIGFDRLPKKTLYVGEFYEGRAVINLEREEKDEPTGNPGYKAGYIDETGRIIIAARFAYAQDFSEGLAYVVTKDFRGFIDRDGKLAIRVEGAPKGEFHEGLAAVASIKGGEWGYIDRSGRMVIKQQYSLADDFSEGLAAVAVDRKKYGFINRKGEMVISPRFVPRALGFEWKPKFELGRFSEGLARVYQEGSPYGVYGYVDRKGNFVIPPRFIAAKDFSEGLAWVVETDQRTGEEKVGWIDKSGRWEITRLDGRSRGALVRASVGTGVEGIAWKYSEGLAPFFFYSRDYRAQWGYMDHTGKVIIEPREYQSVDPFRGGLARVSFYSGADRTRLYPFGYIDKTGKLIWRSD